MSRVFLQMMLFMRLSAFGKCTGIKYQSQYELNISKLKASFNSQVNAAVEKQTAELKKEIVEAIDRFNKLFDENKKTMKEIASLKARLSSRDDVLMLIAKMLWNLIAPAIKHIFDLALNREISIYSEFTPEQATQIKNIINQFSDNPDKQESVAYWLLREADNRQHFTDDQFNQCERELERVVKNQYKLGQSNEWRGGIH